MQVKRDYWQKDRLLDAAKLIKDAADNLGTSYPYSATRPNPHTLPAVEAMLDAALLCIKNARPTTSQQEGT